MQPLGPKQIEWLEALKSGKWTHGTGYLAQTLRGKWVHCCLGVGAEINCIPFTIEKDYDEEIVNYNSEDDMKVLCLMVDEGQVNYNEDIPFVRTLFKVGRHFEYQLVKRSELLFVNDRNGMILDYFDCDF